jgi:beta-phosphoglucomutase-like phosphatase (HAD superfamily)
MLEALIFDVDGTLADTEEAHRLAFNHTFAETGVDWRWDKALYTELLSVTGGKERIKYYLENYHPEFSPPRDMEAFVADLHQRKTEHYQAIVNGGQLPLRPGVARLIAEARQTGIKLAIATTTSPENVTSLLMHSLGPDAPQWFSVIGAGGVVPRKKPWPDIYFHVLEQLGLPASHCLALEDSANGVNAALAAGVKVVVTLCDYTRGDDFSGASLVLDHLGEPDQPFNILAGNAGTARYADLALLRGLLE